MKPRYHQLPAIPRRVEDYRKVEEHIIRVIRRLVYQPLMRELGAGPLSLRNAYDDLLEAVTSGQIQFVRGHFEGRFNAQISAEIRKLGGSWNRARGWWSLPSSSLPIELRSAIGASETKFKEMAAKVDRKLGDILPSEVGDQLVLDRIFDGTIYRADQDFQANVSKITVSPILTRHARARIAREYSRNLTISIRDWIDEEVLELRARIEKAAGAGVRYEDMVDSIQHSYGVTQRKAQFLARQEMSLMMAKFKQVRYTESGIPDYRWTCVRMPKDTSADHHVRGNVRYYHGLLDGKIYRWDTGAPVNAKGERKNPGQDYECRCNGAPVVRF